MHNRTGECRYCNRYGHACGRDHTADTARDWARTWDGHPTARSESA